MNNHGMNDGALASAAFWAAEHISGEGEIDVIEALFNDDELKANFSLACLHYLRAAPTAAPDDVMRFSGAKRLHLVPADYEGAAVEVKLFFDAFTGAAKGLIAQFSPKKSAPRIAPSATFAGDAHDNLHGRLDDEPSRPESSASLRVVPASPAASDAPRGTPSVEEFQRMDPVERRTFSGAYGFPALLDDLASGKPMIDSVAPAAPKVIGPEQFEPDPSRRAGSAAAPAPAKKGKHRR